MGKPKLQQTKKTLTLKEKVDVIKYKDKIRVWRLKLSRKVLRWKNSDTYYLKKPR